MSIKEARTWCAQTFVELRKAPTYWLGVAAIVIVLMWSQDLAPYVGTVVASILTTLVISQIFSPSWKQSARPLMALGVLNSPVTALWLILFSMHLNTSWMQVFSTAWSIPVLFFMSLASWVTGHAAAIIVRDRKNLDQGLKEAWKHLTAKWKTVALMALVLTLLFTLSLVTRGIGFIVSVPFFLALLRTSCPVAERPALQIV